MPYPSHAILCTAFHEAGHAVQTVFEGGSVIRATIEPDHDSAGSVCPKFPWPFDRDRRDRRGYAEAWGRMFLAGPAAQRRHGPGSELRQGSRSDRLMAYGWAEKISRSEREAKALLRLWIVQVKDGVEQR